MNHIYKSIFNKALGVFTAVPEFASAHGKGSERTVVGRVAKGTAGFAASALAISIGLALTSTSAVAAPGIYINDKTDPSCLAVPDSPPPYVGINGIANNQVPTNLSVLGPSQTPPPPSYYALDSMNPCLSSTGANATEHFSTQTNRTLFYGNSAPATVQNNGAKNLTLGGRLDVNSGIIGVGDRGVNGTGATNSIRMGTGTTLDEANKQLNAISIGTDAGVNTASSVAIGYNAKAGQADKFQGQGAVALGYNAQALGTSAISIGEDSSATNGHNGVAIGAYSKTSNEKAISIGAFNTASGAQSIVMAGNYDTNSRGPVSVASGTRATVIGAETTVSGNNSVAIGDKNTVASARTYAIGNNINVAAGADDSLVFGTRAAVGAENTVAIGANANAAQANSVALGAGSATSDVNTGDYTLTTSYTAAGQPVAANGTVSVGSAGKERQIQNVAAGVISATSTDAINGSQLYATNNYMNNFAGDVKTKLGGNAALGNDGHLTMTNIGGTGENTVDDAIKNLKTAIDNKADTTASVTSENQADIKVDKEAPVGNTTNYKLSLGGDAKAKLAKAATALQTVEGDSNITATKDATDPTKVKLALNKNLTADSVTLGDKAGDHAVVNKDGLTIANGPSVKKDGINAGNKKITGVANGNVAAGSTDAVNGGQLAEVKSKADSAVQNVVSANPTALTATKAGDTVTLTPNFIAGDLVNADGTVNAPAAADEGKLVSAKAVADALKANHFVVDTKANGGKTEAGSEADAKVGSSNKVTFEAGKNLTAKQANTANGGATVKFSLQDDISLNSVTAGTGDSQVVLNDAGVNVGNKNYINKDGLNANGNKVANVKAGDVSATSTDAVNGAQLHNVATSVANVLGGNAAVDGNGNVTSSNIGGTGVNTVDDAIKAVNATAAKHTTVVEGKNVKVTKGKNAAGGDEYTVATKDDLDVTSVTAGNTTVNTNGLTITGGPSVTRGGIDAGDRVISGVKAGDVSANSKEAVNGSQLYATNTKLDGVKAKADTAVQDVKSGDENALTAVKDPNTNIVTVTPKLSGDLVDADGNITAPTTPADKGKLVTAGTVAQALANTHFVVDTKATDGELDSTSQADQKIKAGNKVTLQAGKNLKAKQTNGTDGAQVEFSLKDSISLTQVTAGTGDNQVVLGNDGVQVGGNTYINKDGLNANNKVISNVANGVAPTDAVNKGQLDAVKNVADSAVQSVDVVANENNLVVDNTDPKNPKLRLRKAVDLDSIKLENNVGEKSFLNSAGLTIKDGPAVTRSGINANNTKVTNVTDGDVNGTSKDAVNGSQLYNVASNVKDLIGPDAAIDPATGKVTVADPAQGIAGTGKGTIGEAIKSVKDKADTAVQDIKSGDEKALSVTKAGNTYTITPNLSGDLVDADGNITAPATDADKGKLVTAGTVAQALANTHFVVDTEKTDGELDNASKHDQKIKAGNKVTLQAGKNLKAKQTNGTDGAQVEFSLKDSISLTQVTAGEGDNQVVLGNDGVKVGGNTYINNAGLNANGNKITNVADGVDPTDAVNKGQLDAVKTVADSAVKSVDVANGEQNLVVDNSDPKNPKLSLKKDLTVDSVKAGDSTLNTDGLTIAGGPSVKKDGINAGDKTITNVADGVNAKDAVNKGQLDAVDTKVSNVAQNVVNVLGGDAKAEGNGDITMSNIGGTGKNTVHDAIAAVNKSATAAKTKVVNGKNITVDPVVNPDGSTTYTISTAENLDVTSVTAGDSTLNNDGLTITGGPSVKKDGIDAADKKITNVAPGAVTPTSKDAVNGSQLYSVAGNVKDLIGPDVTIDSATGNITVADPAKGIGGTGKGTIGDAIAAVNKSAVAANTKVKAGSNITVNEVIDEKDGSKTYTVSTAKDLNVDSVKAGNTTINNNGIEIVNGPSMTKDGINAAGKAISNVANGNVVKGSKDAVNGGQLHETAQSVADVIGGGATVKDGKVVAGQNGIGNTGQNTVHGAIAAINQNTANNFNQIRGDLRKMDRDLRGGIAGALATAGLPQAFRPGKSMVAAAASTYRGQSGLAIGVSRISDNGKVILKVTGNTNSRGDFGGTIGAGYQW